MWTPRQLARVGWAPFTVLLGHSLAGALLGHEPVVDPLSHFLGGAAMAWAVIVGAPLLVERLGSLKPPAVALLAFGLASAAAVGWEIAEFASDTWLGTRVQIDLSNTMRDLILGLLGAAGCVVGDSIAASRSRFRPLARASSLLVLAALGSIIWTVHVQAQRAFLRDALFFVAHSAREQQLASPGLSDAALRAGIARELRHLSGKASVTHAWFDESGDFVDPWGSKPVLRTTGAGQGLEVIATSPGPDHRLGTRDDISRGVGGS